MTVTFTFTPEIEAGLLAKANARGMALQEYLQSIVERDTLPPERKEMPAEPTGREEAVSRMLEFGEKYNLSLGEPVTRALLHEGHRYFQATRASYGRRNAAERAGSSDFWRRVRRPLRFQGTRAQRTRSARRLRKSFSIV